jgi:hypothetical protein
VGLVPPDIFVIAIVCSGIPACLVRLWFVWWQSVCAGCGLEQRACSCPPSGPMMRPRR